MRVGLLPVSLETEPGDDRGLIAVAVNHLVEHEAGFGVDLALVEGDARLPLLLSHLSRANQP